MVNEIQHEIVACIMSIPPFQSFRNVVISQTVCCPTRRVLQRCRKDEFMLTVYVVQLF